MATRHNCGGPIFGRKTVGCPRCDEFLAGAAPIEWRNARKDDERRAREIREHNCQTSRCGIVCTFGDW